MEDFDGFYIGALLLPLVFAVLLRMLRQKRKAGAAGMGMVLGWNAVLLGLLTSLLFLGGETYYRFMVDTTDTFAINKVSTRWGERYYSYNNFNSRDNVDFQPQRTPGKRRVTFLGDSFTAGHGIKNLEHRLGNRIRAQHPEWEVHVMAVNGVESDVLKDFLIKIQRVDNYELDVVVLGYCLNDISYLTEGISDIYDRIYAFKDNLNWLERESYLINTFAFRLMAMNEPAFDDYYQRLRDTYTGATWEQQKATLTQMINYVRSQNAQLVVVGWPFINTIDDDYYFAEAHYKLQGFWKEQGVPHIDLWPVLAPHLDEELTVNAWDAHPNERANEIVTSVVDSLLQQRVR